VATLGIAEAVARCRRRGSFAVEAGEPTGRKMEWQPRRLAAEAEIPHGRSRKGGEVLTVETRGIAAEKARRIGGESERARERSPGQKGSPGNPRAARI
jgi:hypothetical protein